MNNLGSFSGLQALEIPNFVLAARSVWQETGRMLEGIVDLRRGSGQIFYDVIPVQGAAKKYDMTAPQLQNVVNSPSNPAIQVGIQFARKESQSEIYGFQYKISALDEAQLRFPVRAQILEDMVLAVRKAVDFQIIQTVGRLKLDESTNSSNVLAGVEFFDQGAVDTAPGEPTPLTDRTAASLGGRTDPARLGIGLDGTDHRLYDGTDPTSIIKLATGVASKRIDRLTIEELALARQRIIARGKLESTAPMVMIVNAVTAVTMYLDDKIRLGLSRTSSDYIRTGEVPQIAGFRIIETPILPPGGAILMTTRAIGMSIYDGIGTGHERILEEAGANAFAVWIDMGSVLLYPEEVEFLHVRTTRYALQRPTSINDVTHQYKD